MSLYGGIKFSLPTTDGKDESGQSTSSSTPATPANAAVTSSTLAVEGTKAAGTGNANSKSAGEWSAALKFAPRIPKPKPTSAPAARPTSQASTSTSTTPTVAVTAVNSELQGIVRSAEPVLNAAAIQEKEDQVLFGPDGLPLARAPAMTLAAGTGGGGGKGKAGWKRDRGGGDGQKKKKKKKKKNQQPLMPSFDPEEQYDPNKPNDMGEYQLYRKRLREEKRQRLIEEKRRKAQGLAVGDSDESSYYTDSSEEVAPRRDAPRMFAPPKMYDTPTAPQSAPPVAAAAPAFVPAPPPQVQSGDDAYARRAAMSGNQPASGDDAYARRAAMSNAHAASGDEAYARRLAMSQGHIQHPVPSSFAPPALPPFPPTGFAPPPPAAAAFAPPPPAFTAAAPRPPTLPVSVPPADPSSSGIPGFGASPIPPPPVQSTSDAPGPSIAADGPLDDFAKMLEERKKAAEAIAAKFRALAGAAGAPSGAAGPSVPPIAAAEPEEDTGGGTFAEKMMRKWGHKEGTGLGAHGTGILHALSAEHVTHTKPVDPNQPLSKRQLAKQKAAAANAKNRKWVQAPNARGKIVNANEDERIRAEQERLGEASRVICLVGLVGSVEEVDEDLSDEIGEECSKFGIVERVVLHMVEPPPPDPSECLRVFIVFSGMAGAWRATKELDGRFFGGRKVRATYFDEGRFDAGTRDGPLV